jgi:ArsR family transcriptional regulator
MKPADLQDVVGVCHMFADSTRLSIVAILAKGPKPVMALCEALKFPQPTVSYHLGLLRMARLVNRQRKGKTQIYSLNREMLEPARAFLAKIK